MFVSTLLMVALHAPSLPPTIAMDEPSPAAVAQAVRAPVTEVNSGAPSRLTGLTSLAARMLQVPMAALLTVFPGALVVVGASTFPLKILLGGIALLGLVLLVVGGVLLVGWYIHRNGGTNNFNVRVGCNNNCR